MYRSGLVSVTFRDWSPEAIVAAAVSAGLEGIEWGGDVHVPPGDTRTARRVAAVTADAGLEVVAYGSYYRFDEAFSTDGPSFNAVMDSAEALGASVIRIWAGSKGSAEVSGHERATLVEAARAHGDTAQERGLILAFEYHRGTLTDTRESAAQLMTDISHPAVRILWQPAVGESLRSRLSDLVEVRPWLAHIHCFHWGPSGFDDRRPLSEGTGEWKRYLAAAGATDADIFRWVLLEFLPLRTYADEATGLAEETATLRNLIRQSVTI